MKHNSLLMCSDRRQISGCLEERKEGVQTGTQNLWVVDVFSILIVVRIWFGYTWQDFSNCTFCFTMKTTSHYRIMGGYQASVPVVHFNMWDVVCWLYFSKAFFKNLVGNLLWEIYSIKFASKCQLKGQPILLIALNYFYPCYLLSFWEINYFSLSLSSHWMMKTANTYAVLTLYQAPFWVGLYPSLFLTTTNWSILYLHF